MKRKIEIVLAIICIIAAFYNFDFYNPNQCIVSVLLFVTGVLTLSTNEKLNKVLRLAAVGLAVLLIIRILIYGN
ncbi:hypothetical protein BH20ACI4_BH20ACI4_26880 [soil metagenome]